MADKKGWNPNPGSVGEYFKNQNIKKGDWQDAAAEYEMDPEATYMSAKTDNAMAGVADSFNSLSAEEKAALPEEWQKNIEKRDKAAAKKANYGGSLNNHIKAKKTNGSSTKDYHQHTKMEGPGDITIKDNLMSRFPDKESYNEYKDAEKKGQVERASDEGAKAILAKLWVAHLSGTDEEYENMLTEVGQDIIDNPHHYGTYAVAFKGNKSLMNFIDEVKHGPKDDLDDESNPVPDPNDTDWEDPDAEESMTDNMSLNEIKDEYAKQEKLEAKEAKEEAEAAKAKAEREEFEAKKADFEANKADIQAIMEGKPLPSKEEAHGGAPDFKPIDAIEEAAAKQAKASKDYVKEHAADGRSFPDWFDPSDYDKDLYKAMSIAKYKKQHPRAQVELDMLNRALEINPKLKGTFGYADEDFANYQKQIDEDEILRDKHKKDETARIEKFVEDLASGKLKAEHPSWNFDKALKNRQLWEYDKARVARMLRAQEREKQAALESKSYGSSLEAADPDNLSGNENRMTYGDLANLANIISGRRW